MIKKIYNPYDDLHVWMQRLDRQRHARDEPASAHGDDHGVDVGHLLHDLQPHCALTGEDVRVVVSAGGERLNAFIQDTCMYGSKVSRV